MLLMWVTTESKELSKFCGLHVNEIQDRLITIMITFIIVVSGAVVAGVVVGILAEMRLRLWRP